VPVPLIGRPDLLHIEEQLRRIAALLQRIAERPGGTKVHPELAQIAKLFTAIGDSLEKSAVSGRGVTSVQVRAIAAKLESVAATLRKYA
jgi:hypothetical protein